MKRNFLTVAIIAASAMGFSACSNSYKTAEQASNPTSPVVAESKNKDDRQASWSYVGNTVTEYWGDVEGATTCGIGQEQSPIDIKTVTASAKDAPTINYSQSASLNINDNGHTIVYTPSTSENTITINNEPFELQQFHYHTPSEHQFGSQHYPAEVHFVHANSAGNLAVMGVMLTPGQSNEVVEILLSGTKVSAQNKTDFMANNIDLSAIIPAMPTFYHYEGSLTTPPCSEQVQWYVAKEPVELAPAQIATMASLYEGNNRPVQPQNNRTVEQLSN